MSSVKLSLKTDRTEFVDQFFVLLIALSPILQHYKGLFMDGGVTALILALPYAVIKLILKKEFSSGSVSAVMPLVLFLLFKLVDHGTYLAEAGQVFLLIVYAFVFSSKAISAKVFIRIAVAISCAASLLIILQYICYYVLGFHLQVVSPSLLLDSSEQWFELARTGRVGVTGRMGSLYRPSAFFLEPSHMFIYLFAPLFYELLHPAFSRNRRRIAILISAGIVLSTSGMGIAVTAGAWILYFAKKGGYDARLSLKKLLRPRNVAILAGLAALIIVLYFRVGFVRQAIGRVLNSGGLESTVSGRTARGSAFIRKMSGMQLIVGISDKYSGIGFNMTGFNGTMYKYGIIGTILSYLFYVKCLIDHHDQHFWIAAVIIVISFFTAHTHGTFYMLFFVVFLLDGYSGKTDREKMEELLLKRFRTGSRLQFEHR